MDEDVRLSAQLKSLGKKMFQFRDLVAKIEIPEIMPPAPHDQIFWDMFVKKCATAVTVLKQVQSALLPDMYHLSVHPGEAIWRNPAAVPDLLSMPVVKPGPEPAEIACTREEVRSWNTVLEEAILALETYLESIPAVKKKQSVVSLNETNPEDLHRISELFSMTSQQRSNPGGKLVSP